MVNEIADNQDNVELDGEIEAVHAQLNQLTSKKHDTNLKVNSVNNLGDLDTDLMDKQVSHTLI
jgi:hypothetical protein